MDEFEAHKIFGSRPYTIEGYKRAKEVQSNAANLLETIEKITPTTENGRMIALARTKLEECVMWANKAISREAAINLDPEQEG